MSTLTVQTTKRLTKYGIWLVALAAVVGLILSVIAYFIPHGPIAASWGALLVIVSTALMLIAAVLIALAQIPQWLVILFEVLIILDIIGTGVCAYFLEAYALLAFMVIALVGWALQPLSGSRRISEI